MERKIIISKTLRVAWKSLVSQIWILVGLLVGYLIISLLLCLFVFPPAKGTMSMAGIAVSLLSVVFSILFSLGYTKNLFQALDGEEPQFSAYGQQSRKIIIYLIASILYIIIVCIGLGLFLFPGIYLAIRLQFFSLSIVDENMGIIDSLKRSWSITKGQEIPLFLLLLVIAGLTIVGWGFFLIGSFIVYPLVGLMNCHVFRKLTAFSE
jgi:uncharacterized membrane protein